MDNGNIIKSSGALCPPNKGGNIMITKEIISHMASLSKLSFNDSEKEALSSELNEIISFIDKIKEVDTEEVEPTHQVNRYDSPVREDKIWESLPQNDVIKNTIEEQYGYFKILKVVD